MPYMRRLIRIDAGVLDQTEAIATYSRVFVRRDALYRGRAI